MKKVLFIALTALGMQVSVSAQETETVTTTTTTTTTSTNLNDNPKHGLYVSFGVALADDYKMNDRLKAVGMPELNTAVFESTIGYNVMFEKLSFDLEMATGYMEEKSATDRVRNIQVTFRFRGHYNLIMKEKFFLTAGADLSYMRNDFNINTRDRVIDLNNPTPADYAGHISLYNDQMLLGPSLAVGLFQKSGWPLRLNTGYEWAVAGGKWNSQYANVANSFKESGQGHFYAKLTIGI